MKNSEQNIGFMGITPEKLEKYNREYMRLNPHGTVNVRPKRRRIMRREFVFSIHGAG